MRALVLAAGVGSRLRPYTDRTPKPMLPIGGQPILGYNLALLAAAGFRDVVINVHHLPDVVRAFAGTGERWDMRITYSEEPVLLGTAGALRRALPLLGPAFFVLYGDSYLDIDYRAVFETFKGQDLPGLMTAYRNDGRFDTSNMIYGGGRVLAYRKRDLSPDMRWIDYGLSILPAAWLADLPDDRPVDLSVLLQQAAAAGNLAGHEIFTRFYEIGSPAGLAETDHLLSTSPPVGAIPMTSDYTAGFLAETIQISQSVDGAAIDKMVEILSGVRAGGGRVFFIGVGGGAGHASHAVNDFRKICAMECYAPTDNVSELTARINDDGWDTSYSNWLKGSRLNGKDCLFIFSVGGGNAEKNVSVNLVNCLKLGKEVGAKIIGVVGRDGGYTAQVADAAVVVPIVNGAAVTQHTEAWQAVVWHLMVGHPGLQANAMKWESTR